MATDPVRIDKQAKEDLEDYHEAVGSETKSETATEVVRAGLRELHGPATQKWREIALSASYHLTLVAVMLMILGFGSTILAPGRATAIALVTVTTAVAPIAAVEVFRAVSGQSELGELFRGETP
jgi:hypothetical protein